MTLRDVLNEMMQENQAAGQPADLKIGTVVSVDPLEISINPQMAPLQAGVLYLTSAVIEKKVPVLSHGHTVNGLGHTHALSGAQTSESLMESYATSEALNDIACYENGQALPVKDGYITLNRGLETGDKVLLLRVQHGQRFIILSRVF